MAYMSRKERRAQIIGAAADIVSREGLAAATVRAIATEIACSPGQIHHHFGTADELRAEGMREVWARIGPAISQVLRAIPPKERLRMILICNPDAFTGDLGAKLQIARNLWHEAWEGHHAPCVQSAIVEGSENLRREVLTALQEGQAAGTFPQSNAEETSVRLISASQGFELLISIGAIPEGHTNRATFIEGLLRAEGL